MITPKSLDNAQRYFELRRNFNRDFGIEPDATNKRKQQLTKHLGKLTGIQITGANKEVLRVHAAPEGHALRSLDPEAQATMFAWIVDTPQKPLPYSAYFAEAQTAALGVEERGAYVVRNTPRTLFDIENTIARVIRPELQFAAVEIRTEDSYEIVPLES